MTWESGACKGSSDDQGPITDGGSFLKAMAAGKDREVPGDNRNDKEED